MVKIGPGNGLLPDGNKPLPDPMLTYHQWHPLQNWFISINFYSTYSKWCIWGSFHYHTHNAPQKAWKQWLIKSDAVWSWNWYTFSLKVAFFKLVHHTPTQHWLRQWLGPTQLNGHQIPLTFNKGKVLTHWGQVTHICVSKLTIIGSDNGLSPGRRQTIVWNNAGILLIEPLGTNFSEISIGIQTFSWKKMHLKMSSVKWHPFCLGLNVLINSGLMMNIWIRARGNFWFRQWIRSKSGLAINPDVSSAKFDS